MLHNMTFASLNSNFMFFSMSLLQKRKQYLGDSIALFTFEYLFDLKKKREENNNKIMCDVISTVNFLTFEYPCSVTAFFFFFVENMKVKF